MRTGIATITVALTIAILFASAAKPMVEGDDGESAVWFFGRNPQNQIYVTGAAQGFVRHPHFRPVVSGAISLPEGMLVGGPNSGGLAGDPAQEVLAGQPPMRMYLDDQGSYATNEVAINWQSAWALYLSLLTAVGKWPIAPDRRHQKIQAPNAKGPRNDRGPCVVDMIGV